MKNLRDTLALFFNSARWTDSAILFIRLFIGGMMLFHGVVKIQNYGYIVDSFPSVMGMGSALSFIMITVVEIGCSVLLMTGFLTRLAVVPLIFSMFVATFIAFPEKAFAESELSFIYMGIYVFLFISGPGLYSLDRLFFVSSTKRRYRF